MISALKQGFVAREPRHKVLIPSRMRQDAGWSDVCIHNVSAHGLMAGANTPPAPGSYVEIRRGGQAIVGRVAWRKDRFFGMRAQDRIDISALLAEPRAGKRPAREQTVEDAAERRSRSRLQAEAAAARRLERSRMISSALQFGLMAVAGLSAAGIAALQVHDVLAKPMAEIQAHLSPAQ